jgi:hypothetical protein
MSAIYDMSGLYYKRVTVVNYNNNVSDLYYKTSTSSIPSSSTILAKAKLVSLVNYKSFIV